MPSEVWIARLRLKHAKTPSMVAPHPRPCGRGFQSEPDNPYLLQLMGRTEVYYPFPLPHEVCIIAPLWLI